MEHYKDIIWMIYITTIVGTALFTHILLLLSTGGNLRFSRKTDFDFMSACAIFTKKLCYIFYKQVSVFNILFLFWFNDFLSKFIDFLIYLYKRTLDGE